MDHELILQSTRVLFDHCAHHYLQTSQMADTDLLDLIVRLARPQAGDQALDVACGAGFLASTLAHLVARVEGVDLSGVMLREAERHARSLGLVNTGFQQSDSATLPFGDQVFDIVTCKLALHYFPDPDRSIAEMRRVLRPGGRLVVIDRVSSENRPQQEYHNHIEKLRTPSKIKVYAPSEIRHLIEQQGLVLEQYKDYEQYQDVDEWLQTTGAAEEGQQQARELLQKSISDDLAGLKLFSVNNRLKMTHCTVIMVAVRT
jgi:ubiquinone/menaquinone biosynthesis C-methylase UbiE